MRAAHPVGANGGVEVLVVGVVARTTAPIEEGAVARGDGRTVHHKDLAVGCQSTGEEKGQKKRFV